MDELNRLVEKWSVRARWQRSLAWIMFGLACGLGAALIVAVAARVLPIATRTQLIYFSFACVVAGVLTALIAPWLRAFRRSNFAWARTFDQQFGLRERVSTALEIHDGAVNINSDVLRTLQQADARTAATGVNAKHLLPLRFNKRDAIVSAILMGMLALAILLPNVQEQAVQQRQELRQRFDEQAQAIERAKDTIQNSPFLSEAQKRQAVEALSEAQRALQDPNATQEKALAAINEAQAKLDALRDQLAEQQRTDLKRAGRSLSPDEMTNALAEAMRRENFDRAADLMRNLADRNGQQLTESERQRLANQLDQIARNVQNTDPKMAQDLRRAAQQTRQGQTDEARKSLSQAANSLDRANQTQAQDAEISEAQQRADEARRELSRSSANEAGNPSEQDGQGGQTRSEQFDSDGNASGEGEPEQGESRFGEGEAEGSQASEGGESLGSEGTGSTTQSQHSEDSGSANSVTVPNSRITGQGDPVVLRDLNPEQAPNPQGRSQVAPDGQSRVPYQQVYQEYAKAADDALVNGEVPAGLRDYVREYFSSLEPRRNR